MKKASQAGQHKHLLLVPAFCLFCSLLLMFSACSPGGGSTTTGTATPTGRNTPSTTASGTAVPKSTPTPGSEMVTPPPGVVLGVQPCPSAVKDPAYWTAVIHPGEGEHVESVSCANLMGTPALQALVIVGCDCTGRFLDVYVYNNITGQNPTQIFKLAHLERSDAKISGYNTVLTGETDETSSVNKGAQGDASLKQDLYREFKWSDSASAFVPIAFPGLFPDLTRFQAEADQAQVNSGQQSWKLSATNTAQALAATLLKWNPNAPAILLKGGGTTDLEAEVLVQSTSPGGGSIKVTLDRLEGKTTGIWEVTEVGSAGEAITAPENQASITTPIAVKGMGNAVGGKIGTVMVLDHTYTNIGQADALGASSNGKTTFSVAVPYTSTATSGTISRSQTEEGIVALYTYNSADGSIATAVMMKVLVHG